MRTLILPIFLLASAVPAAYAATPQACEDAGERHFDWLKDLPRGARMALDGKMADRNQPFQSTDVVQKADLPKRRFVRATLSGCRLEVAYEQGGIALFHGTLTLREDGSHWSVVGDSRQGTGRKPAP